MGSRRLCQPTTLTSFIRFSTLGPLLEPIDWTIDQSVSSPLHRSDYFPTSTVISMLNELMYIDTLDRPSNRYLACAPYSPAALLRVDDDSFPASPYGEYGGGAIGPFPTWAPISFSPLVRSADSICSCKDRAVDGLGPGEWGRMMRGVESSCCLASITLLFFLAILLIRQTMHAQNVRIVIVTPATMHGMTMPTKLVLGAELLLEALATAAAVWTPVVVLRVAREVVLAVVEVVDVVDVGEKCAVEHQVAVVSDVVRDVGLGGAVPISDGIGMDQGSWALQ